MRKAITAIAYLCVTPVLAVDGANAPGVVSGDQLPGYGERAAISYGAVADRNVRLVRRYLDATNSWDFDTIRELLHDDVLYELPFAPQSFPKATLGIEAVMRFLRSVPDFATEENLYDISIDSMASNPNELVAQFRSNMKLTSGREYRNRYVLCVTINDGRIIRFSEFFDPIPLVKALGGSIVLPD